MSKQNKFVRYLCMSVVGAVAIVFSQSAEAKAPKGSGVDCQDLQNLGILNRAQESNYSLADLPFINKGVVMRCMAELSNSAKDLYVVYFDDAPVQSIVNVAESDSFRDCREIAKRRPKLNVRCTWGSETIFENVVKAPSPAGVKILSQSGDEDHVGCKDLQQLGIIQTTLAGEENGLLGSFGKAHALRCLAELSKKPVDLYVMRLDGVARFGSPYVTEADALADCRRVAEKHVTKSVRCTWGGEDSL